MRVPALQTHHQYSTRRSSERERERKKKSENGDGRGEKKRDILGLPPSGPHPSSPHAAGPRPFGPPLLRAPTPSSPNSFGRRPSEPPLFLGLGPNVPHFFMLFICSFCTFFIVSISCHFFFFSNFQIFTVLLVVLKKLLNYYFTFFHFSSWGEGRRQTQTPNQFPVWEGDHYSPKPQTSLGFGEEMWGYYPPLPPPKPKPTSLKPVSAAACSDRDGSK